MILLTIYWNIFSIQRKPKISASRKLMLKVREIMNLICQPNCNVMSVSNHRRAAQIDKLHIWISSTWIFHYMSIKNCCLNSCASALIPDHNICRLIVVQSLMVAKAKEELEQEILVKEEEKQNYLAERAPPLNTSGLSLAQLQVTCTTTIAFLVIQNETTPEYSTDVHRCICNFFPCT